MIQNSKVCEACQSDQNTRIETIAGLEVRKCRSCQLISIVNPTTTAVYDRNYVAQRYDKYVTNDQMSDLREIFMVHVIGLYEDLLTGKPFGLFENQKPNLLDVGFGNGSFIRVANFADWEAYGYDVNPTEYPGVRRVSSLPDPILTKERYKAITFFDTLEHFETLQQVRRVSACTDWIFVTAPLAPPVGLFCESVAHRWKHWRPGEHHHYFQPKTVEQIFSWTDTVAGICARAELVHVSHFEDSIRGQLADGVPNTFTCALRCHSVSI